ncbi:hypothetical protein AMJ57_02475 [Parcubacteria bacterium SG8_24]|nr:MAG: hypothetical protein AMJ57_02475 [Parcubacteria bacterium SG8_24]
MTRPTLLSFGATIAGFLLVLAMMFIPAVGEPFQGSEIFLVPFAAFFVFGLLLTVSAFRERPKGRTRAYLLLTGLSAAGIFVGIILHNLVYALFILLGGEDFWERTGLGDEPVFFLMSMLVLPVTFVIGATGSLIRLWKRR